MKEERRLDDIAIFHDVDDDAMFFVPAADQLPPEVPSLAYWARAASATLFPSDESLLASQTTAAMYVSSLLRLAVDQEVPQMANEGTPHEIFVHYRSPTPDPLIVATFVFNARDIAPDEVPQMLRTLTDAEDPLAVEAPAVEPATAGPGPGIRVIRHVDVPGEGVLADLRYAWHIPEHELIYVVRTLFTSPARVASVVDDLDRFGGTIQFVDDVEADRDVHLDKEPATASVATSSRDVDNYHAFCVVRLLHSFWGRGDDRAFADVVLNEARLDRRAPVRVPFVFFFAALVNGIFALGTAGCLMLIYGSFTGYQDDSAAIIGCVIIALVIPAWMITNGVIVLQASKHPRWFCRTSAAIYAAFTGGLLISFFVA